MKKILSLLLCGIMIIGLTGCGNNKSKVETKKYSLGNTVETDIIKLKLLASKYTYAMVRTSGDELGTAKDYNASEDDRNPYVASKGHTLVALSFYVENLDRSSIDLGGNFISVNYKGKEYSNEIKFIATSDDNLNWKNYTSMNVLLLSSEKKYYRCYIDIDEDIKDLDETVDLTIKLPTSDDKTDTFNYIVEKKDRDNYKGDELTEDVAIKNYDKKIVKEYFKNNMNNYSALSTDEIKSVIEGKYFNAYSNTTHGYWHFEMGGSINEGSIGYANRRSYEINDNNLILHWINGKKETITNSVEVRKIREGAYLLIENNETFGLLYK